MAFGEYKKIRNDDWGFAITPSVDGTYEVLDGWYNVAASATGYTSAAERVMIIGDKTVTIALTV